jgi:hypothetical protein
VGLAAPGAFGLPGVWELTAGRSSVAFLDAAADPSGPEAHVTEARTSVALALSDWRTAALRWSLRTSYDDWHAAGRFVGLGGGVEIRHPAAPVALRADASGRWSGAALLPLARVSAVGRRGTPGGAVEAVLVAGAAFTSAASPRGLWAGAGTGAASDALLRAHPLLDGEGAVRGTFHAPRLLHGSGEVRWWLHDAGPLRFGVAAFADAAAAGRAGAAAARAVDAGAGLRLALPGKRAPLRLDVARGLGDGAAALSLGWAVGPP